MCDSIVDNAECQGFDYRNMITKGLPLIFISYSWDSDEHRNWVKQFAMDLEIGGGIFPICDFHLNPGEDLCKFMMDGIRCANKVLIIGTPQYKAKQETATSGGVVFESAIISAELFHSLNSTKFIPILRKGSFSTSFSDELSTRNGYDFTNDEKYADMMKRLIFDLRRVIYQPSIESIPAVSSNGEQQVDSSSLYFERSVLEYLTAHPTASFSEIAKVLGLSSGSAKKVISELVKRRQISRIENAKQQFWQVL